LQHEERRTRVLFSGRSEDAGRVGAPNASFKEIGVRAGTNKEDLVVVYVIDEEPIGLYMAFPKTAPVAGKPVRPEKGRKITITGQRPNNHDELALVFTTSFLSLEISSKFSALAYSSHTVQN
jgi:hypothetical protein